MTLEGVICIADRLAPPPGAEGPVLFQHRFAVVACTLASLVGAVTSLVFAMAGDSSGAVIIGTYAALSLLPVLALRMHFGVVPSFWCQQVLTATAFVLFAWVTSPPDWTIQMWLAILPLTAVLFGGSRGGAVSLALAAVALALMAVGASLHIFVASPAHLASTLARLFSFLGASGVIALVFGSLRDAAVARAEALAQARTLFLANVSHELRTPLNGIVGLTEILLLSSPRDDQRDQLHLLERSAVALIALIDDVLDFARLDAGRLRVERIPIDPRRLAQDVKLLMEPLADKAGLGLKVTVDPEVPTYVVGDPVRMRQILTNLVGNAVKFTRQGSVSLHVRCVGDRLTVLVSDTGIGIDASTLARLFAPFEQADASHARRSGGAGLGLAISRQLAQAMGGSLTATSTPHVGSTFRLEVPLEVTSEAPPPLLSMPTPSGLIGRSVLVVDDNAVNRTVAQLLLKKLGCRADVASNGREALERLQTKAFDIILMDCQMPELDGFEVTRAIRAMPHPIGDLPIIAVTASVLPEDVAACHEAGMNACLAKPVTLQSLVKVLGEAVRLPRQDH